MPAWMSAAVLCFAAAASLFFLPSSKGHLSPVEGSPASR
jgi:hypothetical protein